MRLTKNAKILLYSAVIWAFGEGMLGPLFALFTDKINGSILDLTWAWATYLIVTGTLYIIVGKFIDKKRIKERILLMGYALNTIFTFGYLFVHSISHLFVIQIGLGIAAALATPAWDALYAKHGKEGHYGYQWGLIGGMNAIITGVAIVIGGMIITYFSFEVLFIIMGTVQLVATLYQARILIKN